MKVKAIKKDINAWSVISKWLTISNKCQSDLAVLLDITASAVSQIKSGNILLSARQISLILDYLKINSKDMCALYTLIFNARLNNKTDKDKHSEQKLVVNIENSQNKISTSPTNKDDISVTQDLFRRVPLITFQQAMNYEPALESIESFAKCCSEQTMLFLNGQIGSFALLVDQKNATAEFEHSSVLLVSGVEYPVHGDMVVAKLRDGELITKYYSRQDNIIHLKSKYSDSDTLSWHYQEDPGYIQWMYPIIEANLKLRTNNYKLSD